MAASFSIWPLFTGWGGSVFDPPPHEAITAAPAPPAATADAIRISRRERSFAMRGREASLSGDGDLAGRLGRARGACARRLTQRVLRLCADEGRPRGGGVPVPQPA